MAAENPVATQVGAQPAAVTNVAASIGRNTLFGVLNNFTQVATRLVTVPIVIHHLGLGGYGIWNVIMMTATYMRFGSVGMKTAYQKYVAEATGDGNYGRATELLSTGCAIMLVLSVAALIPAAFLSRHIAASAGVPQEFLASAAGAISLLALILMMSNVGAAFEGIVMGGHRIDLVRKFSTFLSICEAVAIITVLHFGLGIFAMAAVMGTSELCYITACFIASHRIVPQIRLSARAVKKSVLYELFRFAGSLQLVNYFEVFYVSIIPLALLRVFGPEAAGVYAVVTRVVTSATTLQDAFGPPIISGGTMVFASGSSERMKRLIGKAFKVSFALAFFPLGFAAVFGTKLAYVWTGAVDPRFRMAFWVVALSAAFRGLAGLCCLLYRVSGRATLDNVRQLLRIAVILTIAACAHRLGFSGTLAGLAIAELVGMLFMLVVLEFTYGEFELRALAPETARFALAAAVILVVGFAASFVPVPGSLTGRALATAQLIEISFACLLVTWPVLRSTGSVTAEEGRALFKAFLKPKTS